MTHNRREFHPVRQRRRLLLRHGYDFKQGKHVIMMYSDRREQRATE